MAAILLNKKEIEQLKKDNEPFKINATIEIEDNCICVEIITKKRERLIGYVTELYRIEKEI